MACLDYDSAHVFVHVRDARHAGKPVLDLKNAFHTALEEPASRTSRGTISDTTTRRDGDGWRQSPRGSRSCWAIRGCGW